MDEASRSVTQVLDGALSPGDVGKTVTFEMHVDRDTLAIELATTSGDGGTGDAQADLAAVSLGHV